MRKHPEPLPTGSQDPSRRDLLAAVGASVAGAAVSSAAVPVPTASPARDTARITLVQLTTKGDHEAIFAKMVPFFEKATAFGSDLIVFPEYVLGDRISIQHDRVQRFFALARKHRLYAIVGMVESHGPQYATTALLVDRSGNLLGRYLKSHPASGPAPHFWPPVPGHDQEARGILGSTFKVFPLDFAQIGILQCYDGYFPEAWGCTSYLGAEIILWINGRAGSVEDAYCITASECYGCVVGGNITDGRNTGFAGWGCVQAEGIPEESRLFPRIKEPGDACVHATINLRELRCRRKHLRTMHQRRPDMYGPLTQNVTMWQNYPDIPWDRPECPDFVHKAQLDWK